MDDTGGTESQEQAGLVVKYYEFNNGMLASSKAVKVCVRALFGDSIAAMNWLYSKPLLPGQEYLYVVVSRRCVGAKYTGECD